MRVLEHDDARRVRAEDDPGDDEEGDRRQAEAPAEAGEQPGEQERRSEDGELFIRKGGGRASRARPRPPARPRPSRSPARAAARAAARASSAAGPARGNGANTAGSRSLHTSHCAAREPVASRIALTARRAASLAPSIVARSVCVRTKSEARKRFGMRVGASGRSAHEPAVLTSSGSRFVAPVGFGNWIAGSRNQATHVRLVEHRRAVVEVVGQLAPHLRRGSPPACTPSRPCRSAGRAAPTRRRRPRGCPRRARRRSRSRSTPRQNCACEIDVSAHSESM